MSKHFDWKGLLCSIFETIALTIMFLAINVLGSNNIIACILILLTTAIAIGFYLIRSWHDEKLAKLTAK